MLAVDDAPEVRLLMRRALEREGYDVDEAADGPAALVAIAHRTPDVVLLDINMPGMSGFDVLSTLRREHPGLPVILVSARGAEADRVSGLDLGADDYLVKPFGVRELAARVRSVTRRRALAGADSELHFGPIVIDVDARQVTRAGVAVPLRAREFDLLAHIARRPGHVFTRGELLHDVWGSSDEWQDPATVTEHVRRLRRKLEADPDRPVHLVTVRGVGYRLSP